MDRRERVIRGFGGRLKEQRKLSGMTQRDLAARMGTAQDYVAQLERGVRSPTLRTLVNAVEALEVSADELIFGGTFS
jgi:transcriptional regulator with XRE-family HTH domain